MKCVKIEKLTPYTSEYINPFCSNMAVKEDVFTLQQRLIAINQEISKLESLVHSVGKNCDDSDDDDICSEDSPWAGYLSEIFSKLDEFSRDRSIYEQMLRKQGVSTPVRDED